MAQLDSSIILGARQPEDPLASYGKAMQVAGLVNQNRLADLQFQNAERQQQRQNKLTELLSGQYGTPEEREGALLKGGFIDESTKLGTDRRANAKTEAETARAAREGDKFKLENARGKLALVGQILGKVRDQASYDIARQEAVDAGLDVSNMPPQYDPALIEQKRNQSLTMEQQLEQVWKQKGYDLTVRGQDMIDKRTREEGAANRSVTMRGQNMTDARARETAQNTLTKPFEITGEDGKPVLVQQDKQGNIKPVAGFGPKQGASKPLTEGQSKALLFGARMQDANDILSKLEDGGVVKSIPGSRAGYGVGATINAVQPQDRQRLEQAKRDFINAVLRRESGAVISDQEFANAEQQYFPQVGEGKDVVAQKKRAREVATRGILAEVPDSDARVSKVRGSSSGPQAGTVQDGYRFKGGDPADAKNWEKE